MLGGALLGFLWCTYFTLCLQCKEMPPRIQNRFRPSCEKLAFPVLMLIIIVFWGALHPRALEEGHDITGMGAVGDAAGICFGIFIGSILKAWCRAPPAAPRPAAPAPRPAAPAPPPAAPQADLPAVVIAEAVLDIPSYPLASVGVAVAPTAMPPLTEVARILRHELGLKTTDPLIVTIDEACHQLGVPATGNLRDKAEMCWRALGSPSS